MKESIGSVATYNIIMIFIIVTFAVLSGTMSYSKAFKVNNRIINAIEKYEGYNDSAASLIDSNLTTLGYQTRGFKKDLCRVREGQMAMDTFNPNYEFCVYEFDVTSPEWNGRYKQYGVVSYIYLDFLGLSDLIRVPVYGVSNKVFSFKKSNN